MGEELVRLNSSELKNPASGVKFKCNDPNH